MLKKVATVFFCLILNLAQSEERETPPVLSTQTPTAEVEKEQDLSSEVKKDNKGDESTLIKESEAANLPQYADKNLSDALEQLRNEKDQLQTEFEKLLEQQAKTSGLINENKKLKSDLSALQKFKNELNERMELDKQKVDEGEVLAQKLDQALKKNDEMVQEIARLSAKITEYETPKTRQYLVRMGDTLPKIAQRECQDKVTWEDIYALNRTVIKNPNLLFTGMALTLSASCI